MNFLNSRPLKYIKCFYFNLRKSSSFLINDNKYSFLKELGLKEENAGVYDGKWNANGNVSIFNELFQNHLECHTFLHRLQYLFVLQMVYQ